MTTGTVTVGNASSYYYYNKSWSGQDDRIKKAKDNPYTMSYTYQVRPTMERRLDDGRLYNNSIFSLGFGYYQYLTEPWNSSHDVKLLAKLRDALEGHSFNAAVSLAEAHESLSMITNTARHLAKGIWYVSRGNFYAATRHFGLKHRPPHTSRAKDFAHNWLQYKYGWYPLVKDARDAAVALAALTNRPIRQAVTATHSAQVSDLYVHNADFCTVTEKRLKMTRKRYKYYLTEDFSPIASLGFTDPLPVMWELIPYSFVVDWFVPIGSYLEARSFANRMKGSYVLSTRTLSLSTLQDIVPLRHTILNKSYLVGYTRAEQGSFSRTVGSGGLPMPAFPEFKPLSEVLTWQHAISAVSLLVQRFSLASFGRIDRSVYTE